MKRYQKVKNEWGETEEFTKAVLDAQTIITDKGDVIPLSGANFQKKDDLNYSKHITPDHKGTNEPTLKGALTLVLILYLIGFASCYGLFWAGFLHV